MRALNCGESARTRHVAGTWLIVAVAACLAHGLADGQAAPSGDATATRIAELIAQLGDPQWSVREAATQALAAMEDPAIVQALRAAALSEDPEVAIRAKRLLADLLDFTHVALDARGEPIAGATITLSFPDGGDQPLVQTTNLFGGFSLPPDAWQRKGRLQFSHPQYGLAECPASSGQVRGDGLIAGTTEFRVPFVRAGSPAHERALKGVVLGPADQPVEGARIRCSEVRTPGEGLIQYHGDLADVLTDGEGRFSIYVPDPDPRNERGELIPVGSRYHISIEANPDRLFPAAARLVNTEPAVVRLRRPEHFHRFAFEAADGGWLADEQLQYVSVSYAPEGSAGTGLDRRYIDEGGALLLGRYTARLAIPGMEYLPLEVTADSDELLVFRLPPAVTYRGRVIDGHTQKPAAGAFVIGYSGNARQNLAMLTDEQWDALESLPLQPAAVGPAVQAVSEHYSLHAMARTNERGEYEITQPRDARFYGLIAFARDRVPCTVRVYDLQPGPDQRLAVPDLELFPAGKVVVEPMLGEEAAISPRWRIENGPQPAWVGRLRRRLDDDNGVHPEYVHWLKLNEAQLIYVPADILLTLQFDLPYHEQRCTRRLPQPIRVAAGATLDVGEVAFEPAVRLRVRVVDEAGRGVEGVPVRQMYDGTNTWQVAHNSDADGFAEFYADRGSTGQFGVAELLRGDARTAPDAPKVPFTVGSEPPADDFVITLTPAHRAALAGGIR